MRGLEALARRTQACTSASNTEKQDAHQTEAPGVTSASETAADTSVRGKAFTAPWKLGHGGPAALLASLLRKKIR